MAPKLTTVPVSAAIYSPQFDLHLTQTPSIPETSLIFSAEQKLEQSITPFLLL